MSQWQLGLVHMASYLSHTHNSLLYILSGLLKIYLSYQVTVSYFSSISGPSRLSYLFAALWMAWQKYSIFRIYGADDRVSDKKDWWGEKQIPYFKRSCTLWWSVNLSGNWAFNVWIVNFINLQLLIVRLVNHNMPLFVLDNAVHCVWLKHSQPPTPCDTASHRTLHTFLSNLCVYLSKAESVSQSDLCVVYIQITPNCWRAS